MPPIFLKYYKNKSEHINIIKTLARFFNAVEKIKPDWNNPKESIISKGMGVTALLRVLNIIFPIIFVKEMREKWENIDLLKVPDFQRFLAGLENVDFSSDGPYGKTGSGGSISKIKNDILSKLEYIGKPQDLEEFEKNTRLSYLNKFNAYLENAIK